ncbi:MAG: acyl-ACP thioesterase domain-containing protein [Bacteroidota bacterium]
MADDVPLIWHQPFTVRAYEVGPDEHASVLTIADYFQESAGEHASAAGVESFALPDGTGTWVLSRLHLQIARRPAMRQRVTVETWPSGRDGLRALREYRLLDQDGHVLALGTSVWFVLHVERRRPVRLPDQLARFQSDDPERVLPLPAEPVAPDTVDHSASFRVRRSDLDRVGHANNVRFVEWTLEGLPDHSGLAGIDLVYKAEASAGDDVVSEAGPLVDSTRRHRLTRASDQRLLALARTTWTPHDATSSLPSSS